MHVTLGKILVDTSSCDRPEDKLQKGDHRKSLPSFPQEQASLMITCWPLLANISKDFPENFKTMFSGCCLAAVRVLSNAGFRRLTRIHDYSNAKASDAYYLLMAASDFSKKVNMNSFAHGG